MVALRMSVLLLALMIGEGLALFLRQPQDAFGGGAMGTAMDDDTPARPPGYRNAWDDCGGAGASATERMRGIAATVKGFAKDVPFVRHAGQDCGQLGEAGLSPGPGQRIAYPGPAVWQSATDGIAVAEKAERAYGPPDDE